MNRQCGGSNGGSETNVETPGENEKCVYEGTAVGKGEEGDTGKPMKKRNWLGGWPRVSQGRNGVGNDCFLAWASGQTVEPFSEMGHHGGQLV